LQKGKRVEISEFKPAWQELTGGYMIRLDRIKTERDLREVFKYPYKHEHGDKNDMVRRYQARQAMKGRKIQFKFGCLRGLPDIEETGDEEEEGFLQRFNGDRYETIERHDKIGSDSECHAALRHRMKHEVFETDAEFSMEDLETRMDVDLDKGGNGSVQEKLLF